MTLIILNTLLIVCIIGLIYLAYLGFRNQWVCKTRVKMIYSDPDGYAELISYDDMLWKRPFCYNVNKMKKK